MNNWSFDQLFAVLLEVILGENRSIFNQTNIFLYFLEGQGIIYHIIAYDPKIEENVRNLCFGCHGNGFLKFKVVLRKNPEMSKECWATFHLF